MIEDGLPIVEVGAWSLEKHERLRKYVNAYRAARRKFTQKTSANSFIGGATYIDLFCGPGRAQLRETHQIVDGSPLVAFKAAVAGGVPFSEIHLADVNPGYSAAAATRISNAGGSAFSYEGRAEEAAPQIVKRLNPHGLHFAFLDPYNLAGLAFEIIHTLASLKHIDILMHVSAQDIQRNSDRYAGGDHAEFDVFAPGWRSRVDINQNLQALRAAVIEYWRGELRKFGFLDSRAELVRGDRNQRLYWLAFASRHKIANYFWDEIRNISGQGELEF